MALLRMSDALAQVAKRNEKGLGNIGLALKAAAAVEEGRMKDIAIDLKSKEEGGLEPEHFKRKYQKSKADMERDLGTPPSGVKKSFKEFWAQSESKNEQV